jgi:type IV pilus assembly protein PilW
MRKLPSNLPAATVGQRGFGLVELMVALVIGLIVIGAAISVLGVNRQTFRVTENLSRMQEHARISFELMARDVREAAGNACGRNLPVANTILDGGTRWWTDFGDGIRGYTGTQPFPDAGFGTGPGDRIAGTDAIEMKSSNASEGVTVVHHNPAAASFLLNTAQHDLAAGDILMVCDYRQAALFVMTGPAATNNVVVHAATATGDPRNCTKGLGVPVQCTANGTPYEYGPNSMIARLSAVRWYIGANGRGGRSLYRQFANQAAHEIVEDIQAMRLTYVSENGSAYQAANTVANWRTVTGVRIEVDVVGSDPVGEGGQVLRRRVEQFVNLRNRVP